MMMGNLCTASSDIPNPETGISPRESDLISATWAQVVDKAFAKENEVEFFIMLFRVYPDLQRFFRLFSGKTDEQLRESVELHAHAVTVFSVFTAYVEYLQNPELLVALLEKIAHVHAVKDIPLDSFERLSNMFPSYLQLILGKKFTPQAEEAWVKFLKLHSELSTKMIKREIDKLMVTF